MKKISFRLLLAAVVLVALSPPTRAGGLPACLRTPGVEDIFGFTHRIGLVIGGQTWYFLGTELELPNTPDQVGQPQDVPGHCWKLSRPLRNKPRLIGMHFNTGPLIGGSAGRFWSSNSPDHSQLYWVDVIVDRWSARIAAERAKDGYVHYHELVKAGDGCFHPKLVAWLRHSAIEKFSFDGGPPQELPDGRSFRPRNVPHLVHPGIDYNFPPTYDEAYQPGAARPVFGRRVCSSN